MINLSFSQGLKTSPQTNKIILLGPLLLWHFLGPLYDCGTSLGLSMTLSLSGASLWLWNFIVLLCDYETYFLCLFMIVILPVPLYDCDTSCASLWLWYFLCLFMIVKLTSCASLWLWYFLCLFMIVILPVPLYDCDTSCASLWLWNLIPVPLYDCDTSCASLWLWYFLCLFMIVILPVPLYDCVTLPEPLGLCNTSWLWNSLIYNLFYCLNYHLSLLRKFDISSFTVDKLKVNWG